MNSNSFSYDITQVKNKNSENITEVQNPKTKYNIYTSIILI